MRRSLATVAFLLLPRLSFADCGVGSVKIEGANAKETRAACKSLEQVTALFASGGASVAPSFKLVFEDRVLVAFDPLLPEEKTQVYGYFDSDTREIHVTKFDSTVQKGREGFRVAWSDELAASYLLHEITHLVVISYMGADYKKLAHVWHEALAYAVQLKLADPKLRAKILKAYDPSTAFDDRASINSFVYGADPDAFGVRAHLAIEKWSQGSPSYLKDVMDGKVPGTAETL